MTENNNSNVPSWIKAELFEDALRETVGDFKSILKFKAFNALEPGENYATVMLRVQIDVLMNDDSLRTQSFMLKVAHEHKFYQEQMIKFQMFQKEAGMYREVVPELEQIYRDKGIDIHFGAKAYKLPVKDKEYILLEDLAPKGFRNVKRENCLDWFHTKCCLKKLAQWHAASAVRVAQKGPYDTLYLHGFLAEENKVMCDQMINGNRNYVLSAVRTLPDHQQYYKQLENVLSDVTNKVFGQAKFDDTDFSVLNHGDFWCNNIMFQYDEERKVKEIIFVDFQMPRYGPPAQDLWYFILSSTQLEFKVQRFDEMVRYYHDQLVEHLTILGYTKPLPGLRELQKKFLDMGSWAVMTISCIMAGVLCEPTSVATIDNFVEDSEDGETFKKLLFFNERYKKHCEVIFPWLCNRGALDC